MKLQEVLDAVIIKTEEVNGEKMKYYQGMNDVASVFLLTLDQNVAYYSADVASRFIFNDYL